MSLLSCGRLLYHGPRDGLVPWFESLGFEYLPESAGTAPDWALDLVAVGSHKPHPGARAPRTFVGFDQVATASVMFVRKWMAERGMAEGDMPLAAVRGGARGGDDAAKAGPKAEAVAAVAGGKTAAARGGGSWGGGWPNWTRDGSLQQQQQQQQQQATRAPAVERPPYSAAPFPPAPPGCPPAPAAAWLRKARWCYRREVLMVTRNPMDVAGRTMTFAWVAAMTGVLYYALPPDASGARLRVNMLLNSVAFFCLMPYLSLVGGGGARAQGGPGPQCGARAIEPGGAAPKRGRERGALGRSQGLHSAFCTGARAARAACGAAPFTKAAPCGAPAKAALR